MSEIVVNKRWRALFGLSLASFLGCIDFTIVNTALPSIQAGLNASMTQLQWVINIFLLTLSALMVIKGRLADLYGRRRLLYIGMLVFGISSLGAGLSPNIDSLIFFRFVQGIGVAILYTVPVAIISNLFPPKQRGPATGILFGVNGFGLAVGPVVGGFIIGALSWHWVFLVNPPIIIISFLICLFTVPESKSTEHGERIDWAGFILLALAMPLVVLATVEGSHWGWGSFPVLVLYGIAAISCVVFYHVEKRSQSPILKLSLFFNRVFIAGASSNIFLAFFYTVAFFMLPLYLHNILGRSSYQVGLMLLPATCMVALLSPLVGYTVDRFGAKKNLIFGFTLFAASALLQTHFSASSSLLFIIFSLLLLGIGWAFILSPSFVAALSSVPDTMSGVAMGAMGTLHNFGGAMGLAIAMVLFHYQAKANLVAGVLKQHVMPGKWVELAIADPDHAVRIIREATQLSLTHVHELFAIFFMQGYMSLMWLLFVVSMAGLSVVLFGLKSRV